MLFLSPITYSARERFCELRRPDQKKKDADTTNYTWRPCLGRSQKHHATFVVQFLFFALVLLENIILSAFPLIKGGQNRALGCFGTDKIQYGVVLVVVLNMLSWLFQVLHYKLMHSWNQISGPSVKDGKLTFTYYWLCKEKVAIIPFGRQRKPVNLRNPWRNRTLAQARPFGKATTRNASQIEY